MPWAARADSEYLSGTLCGGSRISLSERSDDEHPASSLRHSEETAVENPPRQAVPEVGQRSKHDSEVPTAVRGEQSGYILDEKPSRSKSVGDSGELVEQAGSFAGESGASSGDGHVLAGESSAEKMYDRLDQPPAALNTANVSVSGLAPSSRPRRLNVSYVLVDGDAGPVLGEHLSSPLVRLAEEHVGHSGSVQPEVEPADAREQRADIHLTPLAAVTILTVMEPIAYLTKYDGLLCADCALDTDALVPDGDGTFSRWLNGLTAIPATDVLQDWPEACCEECKRPFALSAAWSR